jgi:hypothetical protein
MRAAQRALADLRLKSPETVAEARVDDAPRGPSSAAEAFMNAAACSAFGSCDECAADTSVRVPVQAQHFESGDTSSSEDDADGGKGEEYVKMMRRLTGNGDDPPRPPAVRSAAPVCAAPGCTRPSAHMCSRCKTAYYCSPEHQLAHWPEHRRTCAAPPPDSDDGGHDETKGDDEYDDPDPGN